MGRWAGVPHHDPVTTPLSLDAAWCADEWMQAGHAGVKRRGTRGAVPWYGCFSSRRYSSVLSRGPRGSAAAAAAAALWIAGVEQDRERAGPRLPFAARGREWEGGPWCWVSGMRAAFAAAGGLLECYAGTQTSVPLSLIIILNDG